MVEVIDASVNWHECYSNPPTLQVLVDEIPAFSDARFECQVLDTGRDLYYADQDGYVRFFTHSGNGNDGGYGGRTYNITLTNGREVSLKGPYSSRAGVMNQYFDDCVEVSITDDPDVLEKGYTFTSGALSLEKAKEAASIAGVSLSLDPQNSEPTWVIVENYPSGWVDYSTPDCEKAYSHTNGKAVIHVYEQSNSPYYEAELIVDGDVVDSNSVNSTNPPAPAIPLMEKYNEQ